MIYLCILFVLLIAAPVRAIEVPLEKKGGVYTLPVRINGVIVLNFTLDSGASEVVIPADVALTLVRANTINENDFLPGKTYKLADGSELKSMRFIIRELEVCGVKVKDVSGSIAPPAGDLLLGQSFLERFDSWTMDNKNRKLAINAGTAKQIAAQETEKKEAEIPKIQVPVAGVATFNKSVVPLLPEPPIERSLLVQAMLEGTKSADLAKTESAKSKLQSVVTPRKCDGKETAREKNASGLQAVTKEDWAGAAKIFYEAYTFCPSDVEILNNLGFALLKVGDYANAEKSLLMTLSFAPTRANAWANLGQVLSLKGDINGGTACFINAFKYSRNEKRTTDILLNFAEFDPSANIQQSARNALKRIGRDRPPNIMAEPKAQ